MFRITLSAWDGFASETPDCQMMLVFPNEPAPAVLRERVRALAQAFLEAAAPTEKERNVDHERTAEGA